LRTKEKVGKENFYATKAKRCVRRGSAITVELIWKAEKGGGEADKGVGGRQKTKPIVYYRYKEATPKADDRIG